MLDTIHEYHYDRAPLCRIPRIFVFTGKVRTAFLGEAIGGASDVSRLCGWRCWLRRPVISLKARSVLLK